MSAELRSVRVGSDSSLLLLPSLLLKQTPLKEYADGDKIGAVEVTSFEFEIELSQAKYGFDLASNLLALGERYFERADYFRADQAVSAAIHMCPGHGFLDNAHGIIKYSRGEIREAQSCFERALRSHVACPEFLLNHGKALFANGNTPAAVSILNSVLHSAEGLSVIASFALARIYGQLGELELAAKYLKASLTDSEEDFGPYMLLAMIYRRREDHKLAKKFLEKALGFKPNSPKASAAYISCLRKLGDIDGAEKFISSLSNDIYELADCDQHLVWLGLMKDDKDGALCSLRRARSRHPYDRHLAAMEVSMLLENGDVESAFTRYEWRTVNIPKKDSERTFIPSWDGKIRKDKLLLVKAEQGIGDQIMFASFIDRLRENGQKIIASTFDRMVPVFQRSMPDVTWVDFRSDLPIDQSIDYEVQAGSLGRFFPEWLGKDYRKAAFLKPRDDLCRYFRDKYRQAADGKPLVGLAWYSSHEKLRDVKNPPLEHWRTILSLENVAFVNLQYGSQSCLLDQIVEETDCKWIVDSEVDQMLDMESFFSQVSAVDIVVTIANTTVHVAGSIGKKYLLIKSSQLGLVSGVSVDSQSIWYPSGVHFSANGIHNWQPTFDRVRESVLENLSVADTDGQRKTQRV